jgi:hypothetical protein
VAAAVLNGRRVGMAIPFRDGGPGGRKAAGL